MKRKIPSILIAEKSVLAVEGMISILDKADEQYRVHITHDIYNVDTIIDEAKKFNPDIMIISQEFFAFHEREFSRLRKEVPNTSFAVFVYSYYTGDNIGMFDATIFITDDAETIVKKITRLYNDTTTNSSNDREPLSEREIAVLKELAEGLSNKQIAEKFNISIHTVISHRKNISEKTGIKSLAGLTIYAISKKFIDVK